MVFGGRFCGEWAHLTCGEAFGIVEWCRSADFGRGDDLKSEPAGGAKIAPLASSHRPGPRLSFRAEALPVPIEDLFHKGSAA